MLGLIVLYWIGKGHYNLANKHLRSGWLYAIIGVAIYYAGTLIAGIIIVLAAGFSGAQWIHTTPDIMLGLLGVPFGLAATWGFRAIMKKQWEKAEKAPVTELLDDGEI
ncbi:MAG: hypothetical protein HRT57_01140 [Crocinitomicaceae bacterium]|nr:hypothetical protein [Crocinitomicaceae bacterium]